MLSTTNIKMQNVDDDGKGLPYLVTLNPPRTPEHMMLKWRTGHPIPSVAASKASLELHTIQGKRRIWFCGAYQGSLISKTGSNRLLLASLGWTQFISPKPIYNIGLLA